jgi:hypothetical protein
MTGKIKDYGILIKTNTSRKMRHFNGHKGIQINENDKT